MNCAHCGESVNQSYIPPIRTEQEMLREVYDYFKLKGNERCVCSAECYAELTYTCYSQMAVLGEWLPTEGLK